MIYSFRKEGGKVSSYRAHSMIKTWVWENMTGSENVEQSFLNVEKKEERKSLVVLESQHHPKNF